LQMGYTEHYKLSSLLVHSSTLLDGYLLQSFKFQTTRAKLLLLLPKHLQFLERLLQDPEKTF
ncbi:hypothetical protein RRG08_067121, partial [Elysia crispata]